MSPLSPHARAFVPLADLLTQLQSLINQIQPRLLSSDMNSSSDKIINSYPATFPSFRVFKRSQRAKLWRSNKEENKQPTYIHNPARPSPQFFKYLKDVKTGKVKVNPAPDDFNHAKGGVIQTTSLSSHSKNLGVIGPLTPIHSDNAPLNSVKSRVFTSPNVLSLPRNPPIPRLPSVSTYPLFRPTIVFG